MRNGYTRQDMWVLEAKSYSDPIWVSVVKSSLSWTDAAAERSSLLRDDLRVTVSVPNDFEDVCFMHLSAHPKIRAPQGSSCPLCFFALTQLLRRFGKLQLSDDKQQNLPASAAGRQPEVSLQRWP